MHIAKASASLDLISNERLLLGIATGDRQFEFPTFKINPNELSQHFQSAVSSLKELWQSSSPQTSNHLFELYEDSGLQVLPKHKHIPIFATGYAKQHIDWLKRIWMDGYFILNHSNNKRHYYSNGIKMKHSNHLCIL